MSRTAGDGARSAASPAARVVGTPAGRGCSGRGDAAAFGRAGRSFAGVPAVDAAVRALLRRRPRPGLF